MTKTTSWKGDKDAKQYLACCNKNGFAYASDRFGQKFCKYHFEWWENEVKKYIDFEVFLNNKYNNYNQLSECEKMQIRDKEFNTFWEYWQTYYKHSA